MSLQGRTIITSDGHDVFISGLTANGKKRTVYTHHALSKRERDILLRHLLWTPPWWKIWVPKWKFKVYP